MVRHAWEEHEGRKPDFTMRVTSRHKTPLDRLVMEAVNIVDLSHGPPEEDLNSKSEWGQPRVPRMRVDMPGPGPSNMGSNPLEDKNPHLRVYVAAVQQAERVGGKSKLRLAWNPPRPEVEPEPEKEGLELKDGTEEKSKENEPIEPNRK